MPTRLTHGQESVDSRAKRGPPSMCRGKSFLLVLAVSIRHRMVTSGFQIYARACCGSMGRVGSGIPQRTGLPTTVCPKCWKLVQAVCGSLTRDRGQRRATSMGPTGGSTSSQSAPFGEPRTGPCGELDRIGRGYSASRTDSGRRSGWTRFTVAVQSKLVGPPATESGSGAVVVPMSIYSPPRHLPGRSLPKFRPVSFRRGEHLITCSSWTTKCGWEDLTGPFATTVIRGSSTPPQTD